MKAFILFVAAIVSMQAMADGKPDTFAILKQAKMVSIQKMENLDTDALVYRIELCADETCDRFEANAEKLQEFSDYVYLFMVFSGGYDKYNTSGSVVITETGPRNNPTVSDAKNKGYAQAVLDTYRGQYNCPQGAGERKCVMHALFKAGGVKRFSVRYDEGETYGEVGEGNDAGAR